MVDLESPSCKDEPVFLLQCFKGTKGLLLSLTREQFQSLSEDGCI